MFSDRLVGDKDHETFNNLIGEKLGILFNLSFNNLCKNKQLPLFGKFYCFFLPKSNLLWEALGALLVTIITTYNARQLLVGLKLKKILVYTVH